MFRRCWRGEAPLWQAFWVVGFLFALILEAVIGVIAGVIIAHYGLFNYPETNPVILTRYLSLIMLPYFLFAYICIWRCGKNSSPVWNVLSKIIVIIGLIAAAMSVVNLLDYASAAEPMNMPIIKNSSPDAKKIYFLQVIQATGPYKDAVDACYQTQGGGSEIKNCGAGQNGVPPEVTAGEGDVGSITVSDNGVITAVGSGLHDLQSETFILTPTPENNTLIWNISGQCVADQLC
jgi:hypothetical protein